MDQDVAHLWQLVNELSDQLTANRALTEALKAQAIDVKGQAVHSGVGFPLRRFNIDITDEQFTSELERFASHLVLENQNLAYENKQLNLLLKEYEQTLEGVMSKFRGVCHAATQHELTLHQYYTSLLQQLQTTHSTSALHDSTTLSTLLQRLSTLIRAALRTVNGEDEEFEHPGFDMPMTSVEKPYNLADVLADIQNISTSSPTIRTRTGTATLNRWLGDQGVSGGYAGKSMARLDWSIEREGEIIRLEEENRLLREMLGVSKDFEPQMQSPPQEEQQQREHQQSPTPSNTQEREEQKDQLRSPPQTENVQEQNSSAEIAGAENPATEEKQSDEPKGYRVDDKDSNRASPKLSNDDKRGNLSDVTNEVKADIDDSAVAEDDEESPTSPSMTATASLVQSLSSSSQSPFKSSPKLSKFATYSGGTPKSPPMNRSNASTPTVSQASGSGTISGIVSSPNTSLSSIFPRQAKTGPTTATTTTVELEDTDVTHGQDTQKSGLSSIPTKTASIAGSTFVEERTSHKNKIEIKKTQTPPVPGSPLGKTPPKTGISLDHAVESRSGAGSTDESSSHDQKQTIEVGLKGRKNRLERRQDTPAIKKTDDEHEQGEGPTNSTAEPSNGEDKKPSYAEIAKEDTTD